MKHEFAAASREEWRSWLMQNRSTVEEVWLVYYKKQYALWLTTAKKTETREKRLKEAIKLLAKNKKLGMK